MGFGMVGGLVAFQVLLMANALGALWRYQKLQLAGLAPSGADVGKQGQVATPPSNGEGVVPPTEGSDADD